jgi:hypothetical protein
MKQVEGSLRERVRCSSLVDWPVYPRLRPTMLTTTPKRNPASNSNRSDARPRPSEAMRGPGESYSAVILRLMMLTWDSGASV